MATTTQPTSARPLPQGKISYEEFLQWLDEDTWAEWVNGEAQIMSPVGIEHGLVAGSEGEYHSAAVEGFWIRVEWLWQRPPIQEVLRAWGWL